MCAGLFCRRMHVAWLAVLGFAASQTLLAEPSSVRSVANNKVKN